jgi:hypothetical protein
MDWEGDGGDFDDGALVIVRIRDAKLRFHVL